MKRQNTTIVLQAIKDYAEVYYITETYCTDSQLTFTVRQQKYAVTICEVDSVITPATDELSPACGVIPSLCLYWSALDFAVAQGAIPLLCAIGTNDVGLIIELPTETKAWRPAKGERVEDFVVSSEGKVSIIAFKKD